MLASAIEARDPYTEGHCNRLSEYCRRFAERIGLGADEVEACRLGGIVHDIGKVMVPDSVLESPFKLTDKQRKIMEQHTTKGEEIYYEWDAVESNPKPVQPGGVPIVVGGHVKNAARRAARFGDGFFPVKGDEARIAELIDVVKDECGKIDRDPAEIEITAPCNVHDLDAIKRLQDLGVSRVITGPPAFDRDGVEKGFDKIANDVLAKL